MEMEKTTADSKERKPLGRRMLNVGILRAEDANAKFGLPISKI